MFSLTEKLVIENLHNFSIIGNIRRINFLKRLNRQIKDETVVESWELYLVKRYNYISIRILAMPLYLIYITIYVLNNVY